jgi:hypothetical protein
VVSDGDGVAEAKEVGGASVTGGCWLGGRLGEAMPVVGGAERRLASHSSKKDWEVGLGPVEPGSGKPLLAGGPKGVDAELRDGRRSQGFEPFIDFFIYQLTRLAVFGR